MVKLIKKKSWTGQTEYHIKEESNPMGAILLIAFVGTLALLAYIAPFALAIGGLLLGLWIAQALFGTKVSGMSSGQSLIAWILMISLSVSGFIGGQVIKDNAFDGGSDQSPQVEQQSIKSNQ